ncbi:MAG: carboxylesterase [Firmicutes bacterium]|nr:carboxylesterase [Bacillota bacterium]
MNLTKLTEAEKQEMMRQKNEVPRELSRAEKIELARQIRSSKVVPFEPTETYKEYLELAVCEEKYVPTREGDTHIYLITPKKTKTCYPLYINMHGGGFVRGYSERETVFASKVASTVGCRVIDIDYKLAPEHPYPAGLHECYDIVKWAISHAKELAIDPENVVIGGHSAGGNFTAAICLWANQTKDFTVKMQILDYAYLDAYTDPGAKITETRFFPVDRARAFNQLYLANNEDKTHPLISPIFASVEMLTGLPPALFITAGLDFLCEEEEKYAAMLVNAGVEVKIKRFLHSHHGFTENCQEEYMESQKLILDTLKQAFFMGLGNRHSSPFAKAENRNGLISG